MNTYQLWVNISQIPNHPDWQQLDTGTEVIAMTYQANDIAELKDRFADRSNNIKLPASANNNRILQFAAQANSASIIPYRKIPCRLLVDGIEIVSSNGGCMVITRTTRKHYECTIYGGTFNFFTALKEKKLNDIDFGFVDNYTWQITAANNSLDGNVLYPIMDWGVGINLTDKTVDPQYLRPCVKIDYVLQTICENQGYLLKVDSAIKHNLSYHYTAMPFQPNTGKPTVKGSYTGGMQHGIADDRYPHSYIFSAVGNGFQPDPFNPSILRFSYIPGGIKKFTIEITFNANYTGAETDSGINCIIGTKHEFVNITGEQTVTKTVFINTVEETPSNIPKYIDIRFESNDMANFEYLQPSIQITQTQEAGVPISYGKSYSLAASLPDITQLDFFKGICQMYGIIVQANHKRKEIFMYSYETLYEKLFPKQKNKKTIFKNWSHKLDATESELNYTLNSYGQINRIKYKENEITENEKSVKIESEGTFIVDDLTLEATKDLFEIPFTALRDRTIVTDIGNIEIARFYIEDDSTLPAHVVNIYEQSDTKLTLQNYNGETYDIFARFSPLHMQSLMSEYYKSLTNNILKKTKVLIEKFWLQPTDVMDFDHSIPIWVGKYNHFFYINKIENYQQGKPTKVELVRL